VNPIYVAKITIRGKNIHKDIGHLNPKTENNIIKIEDTIKVETVIILPDIL